MEENFITADITTFKRWSFLGIRLWFCKSEFQEDISNDGNYKTVIEFKHYKDIYFVWSITEFSRVTDTWVS